MPWYQGPSLLYDLENVYIGSDRNLIDARFPVQWIIRPQSDAYHDLRGYAGQVAGGVFRPGDEVVVLPSGHRSTITRISTLDGDLQAAAPPMSVVIELADDIDISRGSMLSRPHNQPTVASELEATICWMADAPSGHASLPPQAHHADGPRDRGRAALRHRRQYAPPRGRDRAGTQPDRAVRLRTQKPLMLDEYSDSRTTGGFVLIDEATSDTVGAGMVVRAGPEQQIEVHEEIA